MLRLQACKFELRPTGEQTRKLRQFAGSCRFVYNKALSLQQQNYQAVEKYIGYVAMAGHLPGWREHKDTLWLARNDYLHKASHHISKDHAVVCIEALKVANMSRSASGNTQTPGRIVAAKSAQVCHYSHWTDGNRVGCNA